jgi:hypothetical protein
MLVRHVGTPNYFLLIDQLSNPMLSQIKTFVHPPNGARPDAMLAALQTF